MNLRAPAAWLAALGSACLAAAATRPWGLGWLAWAALVPAFVAAGAGAARGRHLLAALVVFVAASGFTAVAYEAALGLSAAAYLLAVPLAAAPFGASALAASWVVRRLGPSWGWLAFPAFWSAAEVAVSQDRLLGVWAMPASAIGYTQAETAAVHLARYGSVTAVGLAVLLMNGLLAQGLLARTRRSRGAALAASLVVLSLPWLAWRGAPPPSGSAEPGRARTVRIVQPNLPATARAAALLEPAAGAALLQDLVRATGATGRSADLTLWPEASWPGALEHAGGVVTAGSEGLSGLPPLLLGAASQDLASGAAANSAFAWAGASLTHVYDKRHLVPLAEAGLRPSAAPAVALVGGVAVAPLICYDVLFPATARRAARAGAELLAVLTDDTFAAGSDVPYQHLRVALFRAVETGLWLAFASNGGPSAVVDPGGRIVALTREGVAAELSAVTELGPGSTPYLRYGEWAGVLVGFTAVGLTGLAGLEGGARRRPRAT